MAFEQASIKVEKEVPFAELRASVERVLAPGKVRELLKRLAGKGVRIRDFDAVLEHRVLEKTDAVLKQSGKTAKQLYQLLPVSDQGQMREFYLFRVEDIDPGLRHKFHQLFQYY